MSQGEGSGSDGTAVKRHDDIEAGVAFDGVLLHPESASFAGQAGLSHSLA